VDNASAVRLLVRYGADINMKGAYYYGNFSGNPIWVSRWLSPVEAAIECNNVDVAEAVLENITSTLSIDSRQWERLCELAVRQNAEQLVKLLVDKCVPSMNNCFCSSSSHSYKRMLMLAVELDACVVAGQLLRKASVNDRVGDVTPLVAAALRGYSCMCRLLIERGARVNASIASENGLVLAVGLCSVRAMEILYTLGCRYQRSLTVNNLASFLFLVDKDLREKQCPVTEGSVLHLAVLTKSIPVVRCLTQLYCANLDGLASKNNTVLHLAALNKDLPMLNELITQLIVAGFSTTAFLSRLNSEGQTALMLALKVTKSKYAPDYCRCEGYFELLEQLQTFLNWKVNFGLEPEVSCSTALARAIACNRPDVIMTMVACNFNSLHYVNRVTPHDDYMPLTLAIRCRSIATIRALLDLGADPNQRSSLTGCTPLIAAVSMVSDNEITHEILDILLAAGADWTQYSATDGSALHAALEHNRSTDIIVFVYIYIRIVLNYTVFFLVNKYWFGQIYCKESTFRVEKCLRVLSEASANETPEVLVANY
jgi:ankyrin repeat protein